MYRPRPVIMAKDNKEGTDVADQKYIVSTKRIHLSITAADDDEAIEKAEERLIKFLKCGAITLTPKKIGDLDEISEETD